MRELVAEVQKIKDYIEEDYVSVLLKIEIKSNKNFFIYDKHTHAFPHERETLF